MAHFAGLVVVNAAQRPRSDQSAAADRSTTISSFSCCGACTRPSPSEEWPRCVLRFRQRSTPANSRVYRAAGPASDPEGSVAGQLVVADNRCTGAGNAPIRARPAPPRRRVPVRAPPRIPLIGGTRFVACQATRTACLFAAAHQSRRLSLFVVTLVLGSQTGSCRRFEPGAPQAVDSVEVTATDGSSVTIAWPPSRNSDSVVGYGVYLNGTQVGTQTADQTKRWRDRQVLSYTIDGLACGTGYTVGVDAVDRDDDHSPITYDHGVDVGLPRYDGAFGAERDAPGRLDRELGGARLDTLVGQRRCGRVRALRLRRARLHRQRRERDADQPQVRHELPDRDRRGRRGRQPLRPGQLVLSAPPPARRATSHRRLPPWSRSRRPPRPLWPCRGRRRPTTSA